MRLAGVVIPHDKHLVGHSDADVLLHAVTDALLGAAGQVDIGDLFPDTDRVNQNRDSAEMLQIVRQQVLGTRFHLMNVDCVVLAQQPKLSPYKRIIRQRLAELLAIEPSQVGLKAKTGEGIGPVGRAEVIEARCVVLVEQREES